MVSDLTRAFQDAIINNPMELSDIAARLGVSRHVLIDALRGEGDEPDAELVEKARRLAVRTLNSFGTWARWAASQG